MKILPMKIRLTRHVRAKRVAIPGLGIAITGLALALSSVPAAADSTGNVVASLEMHPPAVRSLLVSGSPATYNRCWDNTGVLDPTVKMSEPNGVCQATGISVQNTGVAGYISAQTTFMQNGDTPPIQGAEWLICTGMGCSNGGLPGPSQFNVITTSSPLPASNGSTTGLPGGLSPYYTQLSQSVSTGGPGPICDYTLTESTSCAVGAAPAPAKQLSLVVIGPKATDPSTIKWHHTVTWTATDTAPPPPTFSRANQPLKLFYS